MRIGLANSSSPQSSLAPQKIGSNLLDVPSISKTSSIVQPQSLAKKLRSRKEIFDIIENKSQQQQNTYEHQSSKLSQMNMRNLEVNQKSQKTFLNQLYNQDIAPQDSQKTLFYYLKTLAFELIIVILSFIGVFFSFVTFYNFIPGFSQYEVRQTVTIITLLTMLTAIFQTQTRIKWLKEKKEKQNSAKDEYIALLIELIFLMPCPNNIITGSFVLYDNYDNEIMYNVNDLLTPFLLGRVIYVYKFIIHCQLYYGSRPDRLSRLYTVRFGTFNSFKFLINQKPLLIVVIMFSLNLLFLPMMLLLIQGKVNAQLSTFMACLHYTVVTQVTVGYGNVLVVTVLGRIASIAFIMIGVTSTSLLLIFFMRLMEQNSQQEEAHLLLSSLQKRQQITKARVLRIQTQYLFSKKRCSPQQKQKQQQKMNKFRFENRRNILFQRQQPANVKRMMLSNFASVVQMMNQLKEKQSILGKIVQFVIKSDNNDTNVIHDWSGTIDELENEDGLSQQLVSLCMMDMINKSTYNSNMNKRRKKQLQINQQISSTAMLQKIGHNIRKNIISRPILFQK